MPKQTANIFQDTINKWGGRAQMDMAEEEAAELIIALKNYKRNRGTEDDVCEEIADMEIMCAQMRLMFGSSKVDEIKAYKLDRLHKRVYGDAPASMGVLSDG